MRIYWQSFVDAAQNGAYLERLAAWLNEIADHGTRVDVHGLSPPDRDFGRLTEFRCAIPAVDNALAAEEAGVDALVFGHFSPRSPGFEPGRERAFALAPERARADFRELVAHGRKG